MKIIRFLLPAIGLTIPLTALAQGIAAGTVDAVGGALPFFMPSGFCTGSQACGFVDIAAGIVVRFRPVLSIAGVLAIVIFGYRMIVSQEDDVITKARGVMSGTIAGLIMVWLIEPFIHAFYGNVGEVPQNAVPQGVTVMTAEILGLLNWAFTIVAALAIVMIILTALKAIAQSAGEEGVANIRKTVFSVVFGLLLLVFRVVLSEGFVMTTTNPAPVLAAVLTGVSYLMSFLGMIALIIVIYAGFLYVLSMGKEEQATQAKSLLIRAAIGAVVVLLSLALVNFVMLPGVQ